MNSSNLMRGLNRAWLGALLSIVLVSCLPTPANSSVFFPQYARGGTQPTADLYGKLSVRDSCLFIDTGATSYLALWPADFSALVTETGVRVAGVELRFLRVSPWQSEVGSTPSPTQTSLSRGSGKRFRRPAAVGIGLSRSSCQARSNERQDGTYHCLAAISDAGPDGAAALATSSFSSS